MKKNTVIISALVAAFAAAPMASFGQDRHDNRGDHRNDRNDRYDRNDNGDRRNDRGNWAAQTDDRNRGAGPRHDWRKGQRIPPEYNSRQYVVDDWRGHRLSAPPRGYHWVQSGGDYVLVAVATGIIASVLLNH